MGRKSVRLLTSLPVLCMNIDLNLPGPTQLDSQSAPWCTLIGSQCSILNDEAQLFEWKVLTGFLRLAARDK